MDSPFHWIGINGDEPLRRSIIAVDGCDLFDHAIIAS